MPRDTPPPLPRPQRQWQEQQREQQRERTGPLPANPLPTVEARTTYASAPQLRDLKKEAISRFVPDVVRRKKDAVRGTNAGALLEPEEMDRLEAQGYSSYGAPRGERNNAMEGQKEVVGNPDEDERRKRLEEEEARFQRELEMEIDGSRDEGDPGSEAKEPNTRRLQAQIEEVEDEDM